MNIKFNVNPSIFQWDKEAIKAMLKDPSFSAKPGVEDFETWEYNVEASDIIENFVSMMFDEIEVAKHRDVPISGFTATQTETVCYFKELLRNRIAYVNGSFSKSEILASKNSLTYLAPALIQMLMAQIGIVEETTLQIRLVPKYVGGDCEHGKPFSDSWSEFMIKMSKQMRLLTNLIKMFEGPRPKEGNANVISFVWINERLYNQVIDKHPMHSLLASLLITAQENMYNPKLARVNYGTKSMFVHTAMQPDLLGIKMSAYDGEVH